MKDEYQNPVFPQIKKTIDDFISDEDGNITRSKLVTIGTMVLLMSVMAGIDVYATHRSHSSHTSHSSTSYIRDHGNHGSHGSHSNHSNHSSHSSHTSHSNIATHSNSLYSAEGDVQYAPLVENIPGVSSVPQSNSPYIDSALGGNLGKTLPTISGLKTIPKVEEIDDVDLE